MHFREKNLSIARSKLDFPIFLGDEPFNWLSQCEKYFWLANVPGELGVSSNTALQFDSSDMVEVSQDSFQLCALESIL
jgi:hypothetical protein